MKIRLLSILLLSGFLFSCGHQHEDSESIKEARKVHDNLIRIADETGQLMNDKLQKLEDKYSSELAEGDTILADHLEKLNQRLERLSMKLNDWQNQVIEVPGHDHEHGHDHSGHNHGKQPADDLNDEQILEIQKELETQIRQLSDSLKSIEI